MPPDSPKSVIDSMDYKKSGVDIEAGNEVVRRIRPIVRSTFRREVLTDIGGFGGLFRFDSKAYRDPVLVSGSTAILSSALHPVDCTAMGTRLPDAYCWTKAGWPSMSSPRGWVTRWEMSYSSRQGFMLERFLPLCDLLKFMAWPISRAAA